MLGDRPRAGGGSAGGRRRGIWLLVGSGVVALYVVGLALSGIEDAIDAVARAALVPLVAAFVLEVATIATLAMVHRSSASAVGHVLRYRDVLNVSMGAFTLTQTLPGGGAAAGALVVRRLGRLGLEGPIATASLALTATLTTSTIGLIGAGGIAVAVARGELSGAALLVAGAVLLVLLPVLAAVLVVIRSPRLGDWVVQTASKLHPRLGARCEQWRSSLQALTSDPPSPGQLLRIVTWSSVNWLGDIAALGLVFLAFGHSVTVTVLLVGFAVSQLAAAIPLSPGGVGFVEGGMAAAFVALGVALPAATVVVLTYRLLATWLPALSGLPVLLRPPPSRTIGASTTGVLGLDHEE